MNLHPTPESIATARAEMEAERSKHGITEHSFIVGPATVVHELIAEEVRAIPVKQGPAWVILCPQTGCTHRASARTETRAVAALCSHLVSRHDWRK